MNLGKGRSPLIDDFRGIAVLFVIFSHTSNAGVHIIPFVNATGVGKVGVWLFFVLSAFLLTSRLLQENWGKGLYKVLGPYFIHRIFRIFPLYALVILGNFLLGAFDAGKALRHLFLVEGSGIYWAIPVEFTYYLVIPVLVLVFRRGLQSRLWPMLGILAALSLITFWMHGPSLLPKNTIMLWPYIPIFFLGSILAILPERLEMPKHWRILVWVLVPIFLVMVSPAFIRMFDPAFRNVQAHAWGSAIAVAWSLLLFVALSGQTGERVRSIPVLSYVGRISFSAYLLHVPIMKYIHVHKVLPVA